MRFVDTRHKDEPARFETICSIAACAKSKMKAQTKTSQTDRLTGIQVTLQAMRVSIMP